MRSISAFLVVSHLLGLAAAQAGLTWAISGIPDKGLTDITFPMNIMDAPHESGYYFAMQMPIVNSSDIIYTGLQPRPDTTAGTIIHGVFSSFISGTTSTDSHCSNGADGGSGVSCSYEFVGSYVNTWNIVIQNTNGTTWTGTAVDSLTGQEEHIGTMVLPKGTGGLQVGQFGFVEYYPWNSHHDWTCANCPPTRVTFYPPVSKSTIDGETTGTLDGFIRDNCKDYGQAIQDIVIGSVDIIMW